jgi:hypothetical protein
LPSGFQLGLAHGKYSREWAGGMALLTPPHNTLSFWSETPSPKV